MKKVDLFYHCNCNDMLRVFDCRTKQMEYYCSGSISHNTSKMFDGYSSGWGGGAFIGGGYEINFTSNWSLNPQIEIKLH